MRGVNKRYGGRSVQVRTDSGGIPTGFRWKGREYRVRSVLDRWVEGEAWWQAEGLLSVSGQRTFWRVECTSGSVQGTGVYDLSVTAQRWGIEQVMD